MFFCFVCLFVSLLNLEWKWTKVHFHDTKIIATQKNKKNKKKQKTFMFYWDEDKHTEKNSKNDFEVNNFGAANLRNSRKRERNDAEEDNQYITMEEKIDIDEEEMDTDVDENTSEEEEEESSEEYMDESGYEHYCDSIFRDGNILFCVDFLFLFL